MYYKELTFEEALLGGENSPLVGGEGAGEGKDLAFKKVVDYHFKVLTSNYV